MSFGRDVTADDRRRNLRVNTLVERASTTMHAYVAHDDAASLLGELDRLTSTGWRVVHLDRTDDGRVFYAFLESTV